MSCLVQSIYYSGTSKMFVPFLPTWLIRLLLHCSNANVWLWFVSVEVNYKVEPSTRLASSAVWRYWFLNVNVWKLAWLPSWDIYRISCPVLNTLYILSRVRGSVTNKTGSGLDGWIYWRLLFFYNHPSLQSMTIIYNQSTAEDSLHSRTSVSVLNSLIWFGSVQLI
jgi:hypothetical protein